MDPTKIIKTGQIYTIPLPMLSDRGPNPVCRDLSHKKPTSECNTEKVVLIDFKEQKGVICHPEATFGVFERSWNLTEPQMNDVRKVLKEFGLVMGKTSVQYSAKPEGHLSKDSVCISTHAFTQCNSELTVNIGCCSKQSD